MPNPLPIPLMYPKNGFNLLLGGRYERQEGEDSHQLVLPASDSISNLEVLLMITEYLTAKELLYLAQTCQGLRYLLLNSPSVVKQLTLNLFGAGVALPARQLIVLSASSTTEQTEETAAEAARLRYQNTLWVSIVRNFFQCSVDYPQWPLPDVNHENNKKLDCEPGQVSKLLGAPQLLPLANIETLLELLVELTQHEKPLYLFRPLPSNGARTLRQVIAHQLPTTLPVFPALSQKAHLLSLLLLTNHFPKESKTLVEPSAPKRISNNFLCPFDFIEQDVWLLFTHNINLQQYYLLTQLDLYLRTLANQTQEQLDERYLHYDSLLTQPTMPTIEAAYYYLLQSLIKSILDGHPLLSIVTFLLEHYQVAPHQKTQFILDSWQSLRNTLEATEQLEIYYNPNHALTPHHLTQLNYSHPSISLSSQACTALFMLFTFNQLYQAQAALLPEDDELVIALSTLELPLVSANAINWLMLNLLATRHLDANNVLITYLTHSKPLARALRHFLMNTLLDAPDRDQQSQHQLFFAIHAHQIIKTLYLNQAASPTITHWLQFYLNPGFKLILDDLRTKRIAQANVIIQQAQENHSLHLVIVNRLTEAGFSELEIAALLPISRTEISPPFPSLCTQETILNADFFHSLVRHADAQMVLIDGTHKTRVLCNSVQRQCYTLIQTPPYNWPRSSEEEQTALREQLTIDALYQSTRSLIKTSWQALLDLWQGGSTLYPGKNRQNRNIIVRHQHPGLCDNQATSNYTQQLMAQVHAHCQFIQALLTRPAYYALAIAAEPSAITPEAIRKMLETMPQAITMLIHHAKTLRMFILTKGEQLTKLHRLVQQQFKLTTQAFRANEDSKKLFGDSVKFANTYNQYVNLQHALVSLLANYILLFNNYPLQVELTPTFLEQSTRLQFIALIEQLDPQVIAVNPNFEEALTSLQYHLLGKPSQRYQAASAAPVPNSTAALLAQSMQRVTGNQLPSNAPAHQSITNPDNQPRLKRMTH